VGYFTAHGDLDTCIVIRSAYVKTVSPPSRPAPALF
jgi:anthranilate/para-aminobenzoate synthase component I